MSNYRYLTLQDRQELAHRYRRGDRVMEIAAVLGVHPATVYHELERGHTGELDENQRLAYDPIKAQRMFQENIKRRGRKQ